MRTLRWPRSRARNLAAVAVAIPLLGLSLSGAQAAPPQPESCTTPQNGIRSCIPTGPIVDGIGHGTQDSAAFLSGRADVKATKTIVTLPLQLQRIYASETFQRIRPPKGSGQKPRTLYDQPAWVVSSSGPKPTFGIFPVQTVTTLGFGALPVRVDLHLSQVKNDAGLYKPINVHLDALDVIPNTTTAEVTGQLDLRVDNVSVDGVPLDVGPACRIVRPIDLRLQGKNTYNVFTGGLLEGAFDVPAFAGCTDGGQDVSPLLTGTVSGPNNLLRLQQGALGQWDPSRSDGCAPFDTTLPTCEKPPPPKLNPPSGR
ncbi:hypothetical protein ACXR2U_17915 [Jatrophihabitans sp. YIM 134969]